jgi:phosphohistidine phosphatase
MKTLTLLRHAQTVQPGFVLNDFDRPLDPRGRQALQRLGHQLLASNTSPEAIFCSAAIRTEQTLHTLKDYLPTGAHTHLDAQLYNANLETLINKVKKFSDSWKHILVIAHNPGIELLAGWLLPTSLDPVIRRVRTYYPPAGLLSVGLPIESWLDLAPHKANLKTFIDPES